MASNFAAGTVAAPSIYLSTDTGTGLYRIGANNDGFAISGTKLLDLSAALVGITGAATISTTLGVTGATTLAALSATTGNFSSTLATAGDITYTLSQNATDSIKVVNANAGAGALAEMRVTNNTTALFMTASGTGYSGALVTSGVAGYHALSTFGAVGLSIGTNITAAININSSQAVSMTNGLAVTGIITATGEIRGGGASSGSGIGTAFGGTFDGGASSGYGVMASGSVQSVSPLYVWNKATSGDNNFIQFITDATPAGRGSITFNRAGGLTTYNTTSDYRAKDIAGKYETSGETIDQLQVYLGKMKEATISRPMLIAHEAQAVVPYSVTGEKDAEDADGNPIYQQMDHQSFVPLLIAELQSLRKRISQLEAA